MGMGYTYRTLLSSHIMCNITNLTIYLFCLQDLSPYLPSVIPGLKASLLDPVPEVCLVMHHIAMKLHKIYRKCVCI